MKKKGFTPEKSEPLKIVLHTAKYGYSGEEFAKHLKKNHISSEFYDGEYLVLMVTPENTDLDFERLAAAFDDMEPKESLPQPNFSLILSDPMLASPCILIS